MFYLNLLILVATNSLSSKSNPLSLSVVVNKKRKNRKLTILLMPRRVKEEKCYSKSSEKNIIKVSNDIPLPILIIQEKL